MLKNVNHFWNSDFHHVVPYMEFKVRFVFFKPRPVYACSLFGFTSLLHRIAKAWQFTNLKLKLKTCYYHNDNANFELLAERAFKKCMLLQVLDVYFSSYTILSAGRWKYIYFWVCRHDLIKKFNWDVFIKLYFSDFSNWGGAFFLE